ncbi:hypothetical protein [Bifidobacterium bombi]|uniref:Uncharacterized protein n=1 Tax=Bifidobacterium bombi DSM 19703 TaxID=1341695 RepID=A0A080N235_9BIFI|nr:hypothetical protein [Bifidobacterium bombi]KFF30781.1 hypothetical protein BBOMB_0092 [Bifidobacterium bombi DSM 19703]
MDALLMEAAGTDTAQEADDVLLGRLCVEQRREETIKIQVRIPKSWQYELDQAAASVHVSQSAYLRELIRPKAIQTV